MKRKIFLTGSIIGELKFITEVNPGPNYKRNALFECKCGNTFVCSISNAKRKHTISCGCYPNRGNMIHGYSETPEYRVWARIKTRCLNKKEKDYKNYGGRGIIICDRWINSVENFLEDMGKRPTEKHSIDRIDVNGNYEPSNCRWVTPIDQANNRRNTRRINLKGEELTIPQLARKFNINYKILISRIDRRGVETAFNSLGIS